MTDDAEQPEAPPKKRRLSLGKAFGGIAALIAVTATTVGLLFEMEPKLLPCANGEGATISATVIPMTHGIFSGNGGAGAQARVISVDVTLNTTDLRGRNLLIAWTLIPIAKDGSAQPIVDPFEYRQLAPHPFTPATCSDQGGFDVPLNVPPTAHAGRYRALLEVFDQTQAPPWDSGSRIALTESGTFRLYGA